MLVQILDVLCVHALQPEKAGVLARLQSPPFDRGEVCAKAQLLLDKTDAEADVYVSGNGLLDLFENFL